MALFKPSLSQVNSAVEEVSRIVTEMSGIQLGPRQFSMVENRLKSRMFKLGLDDFESYIDFLNNNRENESQALVSLLTTHHTYFFREFSHFEFLLNNSLQRLIQIAKSRGDNKIRIWSAASSRGQEAYSLAMFFDFHLKQLNSGVDFEIWGTDVDPESVQFAKNGVYKHDELKKSPAMYISNNWIRGKEPISEFSKIKAHLKTKCHFEVANLLKCDSFLKDKTFDLIFCRNVFIYFNQQQIKSCTENIIKHLHTDGLLFLGISESLNGLGVKTDLIGPSIYEHTGRRQSRSLTLSSPAVLAPTTEEKKKIYDILCVDDSKSIHVLLNKILTTETGYRIKHVAHNGLEALKLLKDNKYDAITLDMHMPELDGVGFLEKSQNLDRPPVVILSSINRDDTTIAQKALQLGALDYIEKPSLENLAQSSNEIRSKLSLAIKSKKILNSSSSTSADSSTKKQEYVVSSKKKVLIVDDSRTIRELLKKIINEDPRLQVIAEAENPLEVEKLIQNYKPDVITLDIHMPNMDGLTLLKKIQPIYGIPTVMISSISRTEGDYVLDALESGAIDYIQKPSFGDLKEATELIRERVFIASHVKTKTKSSLLKNHRLSGKMDGANLILIGSSTGGTEAIKTIFETLPSEIPPILVVQHIPPIFSAAFADRLNQLMPFEVREARHGDEIRPNLVLIAPGGKQMSVKMINQRLTIQISDDQPVNRHKPSVDYLFESVAKLKLKKVVAMILTGMGADGARGLKQLHDQGAETIAQDQSSCVVFGMPKEAIKLKAAKYVVSLEKIAGQLMSICSQYSRSNSKAS